jgi:hypothetical protein
MKKEDKRKIRLRVSQLIEMNRIKPTPENDDEISRLGKHLSKEVKVEESIVHKRGEWGKMEIFYLMNHVPSIGFERTAENLNRSVDAVKGKFYREIQKQKTSHPAQVEKSAKYSN